MAVSASSVNETLATSTQRYAVWRLYQLLKAGGWTVWGSSDATSYSTTGIDHWSSSYASSAANNGAWIALLKPDSTVVGIAMAFLPSGNFDLYYTIDGFDDTGVDADTAPVSNSDGAYVRNNVTNVFQYTSALEAVATMNCVVQDDGSFMIELINAGSTRCSLLIFSAIDGATEGISDPHCWYDLCTLPAINLFDLSTGSLLAFGTDGTLRRFSAGILANTSATVLGNTVQHGWTSEHYESSVIAYQSGSPFSILGIPRWIKFCGTTVADNTTHGNKAWIKRVSNSNLLLMWDGVTGAGTDVGTTPDMTFSTSGGGGTARLPGNGYHRSRRRPRS